MLQRRRSIISTAKKDIVPTSEGLIAWLDGYDVHYGYTYWTASQLIPSLYPTFRVKYGAGARMVDGLCMKYGEAANAGASILVSNSEFAANNPFYNRGMSATSSFTIEIVFAFHEAAVLIGGATFTGTTATNGPWRYQINHSDGHLYIYANNGSAWGTYITTTHSFTDDHNPHVLTYQKEGTTLRFYLDGILDKEETNSALRINVAQRGNQTSLFRYDGLSSSMGVGQYESMYSYTIYNRALSANEIRRNVSAYFNRYNLYGSMYDAEVEWLQGDATAFFNIGIYADAATKFKIRTFGYFTESFKTRWAFGEIASGSTTRFGVYINGDTSVVRFNYGSSYIDFQTYDHYPEDCTIEVGEGIAKIGNDTRNYTVGSWTTTSNMMIWPGVNSGGTIITNTLKFGEVQIDTKGRTLDLIPVRRGTVGYMYDKIGKQLFRVRTTNNMVVGPDKS